ncbi:MAG: GGDEF domain-containing protein [Bacilli bacterium]|nr:GGDEF domain-containing protein [Bacilli bacterium]
MANLFRMGHEKVFSKAWWLLESFHVAFSLVTMIGLTLLVYFFSIPNPNMILIAGLITFTSIWGYPAGIACGLEMIGYSLFFFSIDHSFFRFDSVGGAKLATILVGVVVTVILVGYLKTSTSNVNVRLREANAMLAQSNAELEEQNLTDALTGIRNRYALRREMLNYLGREVLVGMMDIDNFKQINDSYGHLTGDQVLYHIGKAVREIFGIEHVYRYGGDEILILLPETELKVFTALMNELRSDSSELTFDAQSLSLTFSCGYTYGIPKEKEEFIAMIDQADDALYQVKRSGKNGLNGGPFQSK